jgi:regulatory protein
VAAAQTNTLYSLAKTRMELYPFLLDKAYAYLAARDHSVAELRDKLEKSLLKSAVFEYIPADQGASVLQTVIDELLRRQFLDDHKFAHLWVESRNRFKPRGKYVLQEELKRKGVSSEIINAVLDELGGKETQLAVARTLLSRRTNKTREQNIRFLQSKGFDFGIIRTLLPYD